jgi:hypothetical protein
MPAAPHPSRRRLGRVLAALLAILGLAEAAVRALEPYLPAPEVWADEATAVKVAQLDRIEGGGCVDVVFAGSSMTRDALDPGVFHDADATGRRAYNAALDAASPEMIQQWLTDQVVPRAHPALIVIGLASFDLNDNAGITAAALDAYTAAPYSARGASNEVQRWFTRNLALVRQRPALRSPEAVGHALSLWRDGHRAERPDAAGLPDLLAADGHGLSRRDLEYRGGSGVEAFVRRELLNDFDIGGRQVEALRATVEHLRAAGVDVALLPLPVTDDYVSLHPGGVADQAAFRRALDAVAEATGVPVLDAPELPVAAFADTHHLNGSGADELSAALPELLGRAGLPARRC